MLARLIAMVAAALTLLLAVAALAVDGAAPADAFDFLIGDWRADVRIALPDGTVAVQKATWSARRVLDGGAIFEEYRATGADGDVQVLGSNLRHYSAALGRWVMHWFDALNGTLTPLGPPELGGVTVAKGVISFRFRSGDVLSRARFEDITRESFVWHGDVSGDDGETWRLDTIVVTARRAR